MPSPWLQIQFTKDDLEILFCSDECLNRYLQFLKFSESFDYFNLLKVESISTLSLLSKYFNENENLNEVSKMAKQILKKNPMVKKQSEMYNKYIEDLSSKLDKLILG